MFSPKILLSIVRILLMKKHIVSISLILAALFFVGCAITSPDVNTSIGNSNSTSKPSPIETPTSEHNTENSQLPQNSQYTEAIEFASAPFILFLEKCNFFVFLNDELDSPEILKEEKYYTTIRNISSTYLRANDQENSVTTPTNETGNPYYPIKDFKLLTLDIFGIDVDYVSLAKELGEYFPAPDEMICIPWERDSGNYVGYADEKNIIFNNDQIVITVKIATQDTLDMNPSEVRALKTLTYTFEYLPSNMDCPYRLVNIKPAS